MRHVKLAIPLGLVIATSGCVSRAEMDAAKQQLATCEEEKKSSLKATNDCQDRFAQESERWDAIGQQLTTTLPATLREFQDERNKIIEILPEQVRSEVGKRLDRYFVNVTKQFERMEGKTEALREELGQARAQLAGLSESTRAVEGKVDATRQAVLSGNVRNEDYHRKAADLIATIAEFDRDRVNCEKCQERIRLKGDGREQLLAFHSQVIQQVQMLGTDGLIE